MLTKLHHWWQEKRSSFWFVPAVMVLDAVVLATVLITVDATVDLHVVERWPLVFGAGAAGARGLLTAVAGSMITVAGVVFSITLVALSLTSSQYTSRVIRNFMRDRVNQVVLGVFVGIFAYCLVVLRTIRGGDEGAFVPALAVLAGLDSCFRRDRLSDLLHPPHLDVHPGVEHYCQGSRGDHRGRGSVVSQGDG